VLTENIGTFRRGGLDLKRKLLVNDVEGKQREIVDKTFDSDKGISV
jgi:hypothetical protein